MTEKEKVLGRGRTADVLEWEEGKVLKRFHEGIPKSWIEHEFAVAKAVHRAGVPSPQAYELLETEEGAGIVFAKVPGASMFDGLQKAPWKLNRSSRILARLHCRMHASHADGLPLQKDGLPERIQHSAEFLGEAADPIIRYTEQLPAGTSVCHGDFHPGNLMESRGEWVVLDWTTVESGNPAADVARTLIMLRSPYMPPETGALMRKLSLLFKRRLEKGYLKEYLKISGMKESEIEAWMLPIAAARLREQVPGEREWLLAMIRERLSRWTN